MTVLPFKDSDPMPFGKYKGEKIGDVPASYLLWWFDEQAKEDECKYPELFAYIKKDHAHLLKEAKKR